MIIVSIPNNNLPEREYIIDIIFNEFLGLKYTIEIGSDSYAITLKNSQKLVIEDTFFNKYPNDLEYLKLKNIPSSIEDLDIFAQCFFMLSRWEEYVNKNRDSHNRFPATESLAFKEGFLDRPIVNEQIEKLKNMLLELDSSIKFREKEFQLILTHDVDNLYFWKSKKQLLHIVVGDILKRKNLLLAYRRIKEYIAVKSEKIKDPFDTFDWLMDRSEEIGVKSRFYFMSGGVTQYDNNYKIDEPKALELIEKIKKRGHVIGIHPSYNAYNDSMQFQKERELLEQITKEKIVEGREHYLRFEVPTTWQIWEDNGMEVDSTCGYADREGFRCGTGDEFSVFNILTREKLKLKERPLIVMDCGLFEYNGYTYKEAKAKLNSLWKKSTLFTLLWHNSYIEYIKFYGDQIAKSNLNSTK
jgi:hypothetical protein